MNNQLSKIENQAVVTQQNFSLVPKTMTEAIELSKMMANSDLVPRDYKGKAGNVLIAVQMGAEIGLSPMSSIQNIAVVNGKPSIYGDVGKALLLSKGFLIDANDISEIKKTGVARCKITRPGHPPCERTFSIDNAKTAGLWGKQGPWTQYPERQLAWRAFWFAARDIAADALSGLYGVEEVMDYATAKVSDVNPEHRNEPIIEAIEQPSEESPAIISRFLSLNEKISEEWGEDTYKHFLKNSKGESPSINQIKTWRLPKQLALLRTACDKIEQQFKDEFAKVDARKEELKAQAKMLEESESEMVSEIIKTMDAEVVNG